ncbi:MAG: helix-turn-helix transcriptional regulator [Cyanobacteria bacterium P01_D01_bin.56]
MKKESGRGWFVERRKVLGITQKDLADSLGLNPRAISDWENGRHTPKLTPKQMHTLCAKLQCTLLDLVEMFEPSTKVEGA